MSWFKKIIIPAIIACLFMPAVSMAASCCICTISQTYGGGMGQVITETEVYKSITTDPDCNETKQESLEGFGKNVLCKIVKDSRCGSEPEIITTKLEDEFKFSDVILGIKIPNLKFSAPPSEVDEEGNLYIPWIGEYIKAVYNFALVAISIIAVVVLIVQGARIIVSAGGPQKSAAYKGIAGAVIGLFIAWGSYIILFSINPDLVQFRSLQIKFIEPDFIEEYIGTVDDDIDLSGPSNKSLPAATGGTPYAKLKSVCAGGSLTEQSLKAVVPTWVKIGSQGGAIYVRGGFTSNKGCNIHWAQNTFMIKFFLDKGISFPASNKVGINYTTKDQFKIDFGKLSENDKKLFKNDTDLRTKLLRIYTEFFEKNHKGKLCGDCGTWIQQLYKCAGLPNNLAIPQLKVTGKEPYFLAGGKGKTCSQAINDAGDEGGLKFGDIFYSSGNGHWFMFTGGIGLNYEIAEMGGGKGSVRTKENIRDYFIIKNIKKANKDKVSNKGCFIYRIIGK